MEIEVAREPLIERLVRQRLLRMEGTLLIPTLAGLAVTDSLARDFEIREK